LHRSVRIVGGRHRDGRVGERFDDELLMVFADRIEERREPVTVARFFSKRTTSSATACPYPVNSNRPSTFCARSRSESHPVKRWLVARDTSNAASISRRSSGA
jgi:hypothetical protein